MGLFRFAVKSSIVGGIVYYTIQEGLWSKPEESVKLYGKFYNTVTPYIKENVSKEMINELSELPSMSDVTNVIKNNWNKGVLTSMKFLADLPTHTCNGIGTLMKQPAINDLIKTITVSQDEKQKSEKANQ